MEWRKSERKEREKKMGTKLATITTISFGIIIFSNNKQMLKLSAFLKTDFWYSITTTVEHIRLIFFVANYAGNSWKRANLFWYVWWVSFWKFEIITSFVLPIIHDCFKAKYNYYYQHNLIFIHINRTLSLTNEMYVCR